MTRRHACGEQQCHVHALSGQLAAQHLTIADDGRLLSNVSRHANADLEEAGRRGEDDVAPSRCRTMQRQERGDRADDAARIHRHHPLPVLLGQGIDRTELLYADVGADHVAPTKTFGDHRHRGFNRGPIGNIDAQARHFGAAGAKICRVGFDACSVYVQYNPALPR